MLSEAKHLQYLVENMQMQILRCDQDDSRGDFSAAREAPVKVWLQGLKALPKPHAARLG